MKTEGHEVVDDLRVQAMMFDMEVDWETLTLVPKSEEEDQPIWLKKWKEKEHNGDRQPEDYQGWE